MKFPTLVNAEIMSTREMKIHFEIYIFGCPYTFQLPIFCGAEECHPRVEDIVVW